MAFSLSDTVSIHNSKTTPMPATEDSACNGDTSLSGRPTAQSGPCLENLRHCRADPGNMTAPCARPADQVCQESSELNITCQGENHMGVRSREEEDNSGTRNRVEPNVKKENDKDIATVFGEPVSLSTTSSLLREVQRLEQVHDQDFGLTEKMAGDHGDGETGCAGDTVILHGNEQSKESVTYHVLESSAGVKYESAAGSDEASAADEKATEGSDAFDGRTITLVEDENNAGTFKIAEIGEDNTLRVIDNNRIVVFQDEATMNSVCKTETRFQTDKVLTHVDVGSSASFISQSINTLQNADGSFDIPNTLSATRALNDNNDADVYEEGRQMTLRKAGDSITSQPYMSNHERTDRVQGIQTYADTSILKPMHADPHVYQQQQQQLQPRSGNSSFMSSDDRDPGPSHPQSWHLPPDRAGPQQQNVHYRAAYDSASHATNGHSGAAPVSALHGHAQFSEYGPASPSSSAISHGRHGEVTTPTYPAYIQHQMGTWAPAGTYCVRWLAGVFNKFQFWSLFFYYCK